MTPDELRQSREALGYSQSGLAEALRMGKNGAKRIREMEQGDKEISGPIESYVRLRLKSAALDNCEAADVLRALD